MRAPQLTFQEALAVFRRRRPSFVFPFSIVFGLCVVGAFVLPRKYESSTTIMVQRDEVLNPLVSYTMAVTMASEDRLRTFNEIVYSKKTITVLIDSLQLNEVETTEKERQELIETIRKNITTERPGSSTFRISYLDTDPVRAQRAASLLANYFIETILKVENQRNEMTVEFFEKKLEELRQKYETGQKEMVTLLRSRISEMPMESRVVSGKLEDVEKDIGEIDDRVKTYQREFTTLKAFPEALYTNNGMQLLFDLSRKDLPHVGELRSLVARYDELTRRYTAQYPEVQRLQKQISHHLEIMKNAVETEIAKSRKARWDMERRRSQLVEELKKLSVTQQLDRDKESNLGIYRGLYDEMKIKLEQARTTRDIGRRSGEQFIIIDPALVPTEPSKPNRLLIIIGGLCFGTFLGIFAVATAEMLDTRIRAARDVSPYKKRVIAYIHDGTTHRPVSIG